MKIYAVCSTSNSWMNTGYGAALLQADVADLLVSFEEFSKDPRQKLAVAPRPPYEPKAKEEP